MDSLGFFDQFFYKADQYNVLRAVMGGASILEPTSPESPLHAEAIAGHLANRLGRIALLRTRFIQDPLRLGSVKKLEDPDFYIWDHITVETLPAPGDYRQLSRRLADISATPLSLSQLWRWVVIDGLEGGKLAVMCSIHHAVADGVGMVEALNSMYDPTPVAPEQAEPEQGEKQAEEPPGALKMLGHALLESGDRLWIKTPLFVLKNTGKILTALGQGVRDKIATGKDVDGDKVMLQVSNTSLNISAYSDHRALSWKTLPLPRVKQLAKSFGATVNDVGLLLYSYAMQHYFEHNSEKVDFDLWCAMPISTRSSSSATGGNQVTTGRVCLHNTIADPVARLAAIHADSEDIKDLMRPDDPIFDTAELAALVFPIAIDATLFLTDKLDLLGRLSSNMVLANALFSNVPGPRQPVYVANGRMIESIPMIPALDILAVSGGMTSVDQSITIGFHCDGAVVEDPDIFVQGVERGLNLLNKAAGAGPKTRIRAKPKTKGAVKARTTAKARSFSAGAMS